MLGMAFFVSKGARCAAGWGRGSPVGQVQVSGSMSAVMRLEEVTWRIGFSRRLDALAAAGGEAFIAPGGERAHSPPGARRPLSPSGRTGPAEARTAAAVPPLLRRAPRLPALHAATPCAGGDSARAGARGSPCAQLKTALSLRLQSWESNLPPGPPWWVMLCVNLSGLRDAQIAGKT